MSVLSGIIAVWFATSLMLAWFVGRAIKDGYRVEGETLHSDARRATRYPWTEGAPGSASFDEPTPVRWDLCNTRSASHDEAVVSDECDFADCNDPPTVEAIASYDRVFGIEQTMALALCRHHADALRDELVLLEVA